MTKIYFLCFLLFVALNSVYAKKLVVSIYYESLCPDSLRFVNKQLKPNWNDFAPYADLILIPFGKSNSIDDGKDFSCQHGPKECIGNKLQSCALSGITDSRAQVDFVHCFMNVFSDENVGHECAASIGLPWQYIANCFISESGTFLQLQAEDATRNIAPRFVPTIVFNGVFNQEDQNLAFKDFKSAICKYLQRAPVCEQNYAIKIQ